ncbi:MAG: hypothetical protein K2J48_07690 [Muribaculaceae bacterium]|nr:hypothetical protein [Muribaculaceae bacterium]
MAAIAISFTSCSDVEMPESLGITNRIGTVETRSSNASLLSFESKEAFDAEVAILTALSSDEEKIQWVNKNHPNFTSIQSVYWEAMDEMAEIEEVNQENYEVFAQKYQTLYFPRFMEDAGFYVPMTNLDEAFLVNVNYEVSIAGEIINLKDIEEYSTLVELGRAYYSIESPIPLATLTPFYINSTSMNSVGPEYDSGWTQYGDRKVKLKARRKFNTIQMAQGFNGSESVLHLEFCFRKKTWLGWTNSNSTSTIEFKATLPGGGIVGPVSFSHSGNSSHDSELPYPIHISSDASHWYYTFPEAPCEATINYRGVSQILKYNWNMPGIQCVTPLTVNHAPILPYY